ncbi:MAG: glycoside hydrolase family 1 protein [Candidatus Helarchaeota archaeon]
MSEKQYYDLEFPKDFIWGSATSAHQVEGNNKNNHWWVWEQEGGNIADGTISGIACDHYNRYIEDIKLIKEFGHQCYRFSIEWSRIEPEEGRFSSKEIEHYRNVLNTLIENQITPMVTLHHFTNPIWLQKIGAWENSEIIDLFERYTIRIAEELGDLIPYWNTINEPSIVSLLGYLMGIHPPNKKDMSSYLKVNINLLKSHGKAYHAIHKTVKSVNVPFFNSNRPQVGIVKNLIKFEPFDPDSKADVKEAKFRAQTQNWWFLDGIGTGKISPPFGQNEEVKFLKNSADFIGVNYYTRFLVRAHAKPKVVSGQLEKNDLGWEIYPEGLYELLLNLKKYNKPIIITENGIGTTDDERRCKFILQHLKAIYRAIKQDVAVRGYLHWSTMDNFEWAEGFRLRFGLIEIDYKTLKRKPLPSAYLYRDIIKNNKISKEIQEKYGL